MLLFVGGERERDAIEYSSVWKEKGTKNLIFTLILVNVTIRNQHFKNKNSFFLFRVINKPRRRYDKQKRKQEARSKQNNQIITIHYKPPPYITAIK